MLLITWFIFSFISTSVTTATDSFIYELPYATGTQHKIVQGYGGLFSHYHTAALDFEMPVGTAVHAARGGTVYSYRDQFNEGGPFPEYKSKANYIMIKHSDGSYGCYWHLQKNGVVTKTGSVVQGQLIGYSGNSGFTLQPHLHFSVKTLLKYEKDAYIKTKFRTENGPQFLERRQTYKKPERQ